MGGARITDGPFQVEIIPGSCLHTDLPLSELGTFEDGLQLLLAVSAAILVVCKVVRLHAQEVNRLEHHSMAAYFSSQLMLTGPFEYLKPEWIAVVVPPSRMECNVGYRT